MAGKTKIIKSVKKPIAKKENFGVLLKQISGDIKLMKGDIGSMKGDIGSMKGDIGSMKGDIKRMDGSINRLIDGHVELAGKVNSVDEHVNSLEGEMREGFIGVWRGINKFKDETHANFQELFEFRDETKANFSQVLDCLSAIDDELVEIKKELKRLDENKTGTQDYILLENRVAKLENQLQDCKILVKDGK